VSVIASVPTAYWTKKSVAVFHIVPAVNLTTVSIAQYVELTMRGIAVTPVATTSVTGDVLMYKSTEVSIKTELNSLCNIFESHNFV